MSTINDLQMPSHWRDLPQRPARMRRRIRNATTALVRFVDGLRESSGDRSTIEAPQRVEVRREWCR